VIRGGAEHPWFYNRPGSGIQGSIARRTEGRIEAKSEVFGSQKRADALP
jgi:hypothetical protein